MRCQPARPQGRARESSLIAPARPHEGQEARVPEASTCGYTRAGHVPIPGVFLQPSLSPSLVKVASCPSLTDSPRKPQNHNPSHHLSVPLPPQSHPMLAYACHLSVHTHAHACTQPPTPPPPLLNIKTTSSAKMKSIIYSNNRLSTAPPADDWYP